MIIAVEGPDKAGKTSLIEEFCLVEWTKNRRAWKVLNFSYPKLYRMYNGEASELAKLEAFSSYVQAFEVFRVWPKQFDLICDRLCFGELAYAFVRGYTYDPKEQKKFIQYCAARMNELDIPLVYVRADFNVIEKRYVDEMDEYVSIISLQRICENYERIFKPQFGDFSVDKMLVIDSSNKTVKQEVEKLRQFLCLSI